MGGMKTLKSLHFTPEHTNGFGPKRRFEWTPSEFDFEISQDFCQGRFFISQKSGGGNNSLLIFHGTVRKVLEELM